MKERRNSRTFALSGATSRSVKEDPVTKNVTVRYSTPDDGVKEEEFDMVVLSVGLNPPRDAQGLADTVRHRAYFPRVLPNDTRQSHGDYAARNIHQRRFSGSHGYSRIGLEPPAGRAPSAANSSITGAESWPEERVYPPERNVSEEEPRIGVFVCHCGANIGRVVDVPSSVEYAMTLPNVVYAQEQLFSCATNSAKEIADMIQGEGAQSGGHRRLLPPDAGAAVPGHPAGSGNQSILSRHGQHPGA